MTVSVCVATFNGAPFIGAQLQSILASPLVSEVLVSDDGSTDGTRAAVEELADPRVRLLQGPGAGLIRNFEFLLSQASGDYIFLSDQDDIWLPEKVPVMLEHLARVDLVVSDCAVVDARLDLLHPSFFALRKSHPGLLRNIIRNSYLGCCIAFRRELLRHALPFPSRIPMHDWWLGLVADAFGSVEFIPETLLLYRRHGLNASSTAERSGATLLQQLRWRAAVVAALLVRTLHSRTSLKPFREQS